MSQTSAHKFHPGSLVVVQQPEVSTSMFFLKLRSSEWTLRTLTCMVSKDHLPFASSNGNESMEHHFVRWVRLIDCEKVTFNPLLLGFKTEKIYFFDHFTCLLCFVYIWQNDISTPYCPLWIICPIPTPIWTALVAVTRKGWCKWRTILSS
jgi:hypothetical protein